MEKIMKYNSQQIAEKLNELQKKKGGNTHWNSKNFRQFIRYKKNITRHECPCASKNYLYDLDEILELFE